MPRFKLYLEYEGTRYSGWQMQKNAKTIQGTLLTAAEEVFKEKSIELQGAGRTDSGVHALGQTAHLDVKTMLAPHIIRMKLNDILPKDINILEIEKVHPGFHARHDAVLRSYIYQIAKRRTALAKNYVWWIKDILNVKEMDSATRLLLGMQDFISFSDDSGDEKSTKVKIEKVQIKETESLILIRIIGSHFLWKMVRRVVGVLAEIGRGKKSQKDLLNYLNNKTEEPKLYTAPPSGLFLERIYYKGEKPEEELKPVTLI